MKKTAFIFSAALIFIIGVCSTDAYAQDVLVSDILQNTENYLNKTVTLEGQVISGEPDPQADGGAYQLQDESTEELTVRTNELPPIGKVFSVTGTIHQDPETNEVYMEETSRSPAPYPSTTRTLLIIGVILFAILLIVLIYFLLKRRKTAEEPIPPPEETPE